MSSEDIEKNEVEDEGKEDGDEKQQARWSPYMRDGAELLTADSQLD